LVLQVKSFDARLGRLRLVEVLVYGCRLRFSKADEIDDVGEYFNEAVMCWFREVREGEIIDSTLRHGIMLALFVILER